MPHGNQNLQGPPPKIPSPAKPPQTVLPGEEIRLDQYVLGPIEPASTVSDQEVKPETEEEEQKAVVEEHTAENDVEEGTLVQKVECDLCLQIVPYY